MRATTILTTLFAVAVSAAALPAVAEAVDVYVNVDAHAETIAVALEKRGNCDHGYFDCVTGQQVFCNFLGLCGGGIPAIACTQQCIQRINEDCRRWCN
ncbi:hypothetical protein FLAG1_11111 [Fusarium langsethiae]|uniref:Uncharacterized protein n=1 Tax=Fusarium langsethiae TaxID=179993 RepID=A0A0M9EML5_FUSLA|nr:hypothetical protein FLAG1_11111 [Fusarium langsethiae]GKU08307.1 unnamed protein product [Fusarium langsethiae]GKU22867.1 unnamed protein product [Fusarium langsethiae]